MTKIKEGDYSLGKNASEEDLMLDQPGLWVEPSARQKIKTFFRAMGLTPHNIAQLREFVELSLQEKDTKGQYFQPVALGDTVQVHAGKLAGKKAVVINRLRDKSTNKLVWIVKTPGGTTDKVEEIDLSPHVPSLGEDQQGDFSIDRENAQLSDLRYATLAKNLYFKFGTGDSIKDSKLDWQKVITKWVDSIQRTRGMEIDQERLYEALMVLLQQEYNKKSYTYNTVGSRF